MTVEQINVEYLISDAEECADIVITDAIYALHGVVVEHLKGYRCRKFGQKVLDNFPKHQWITRRS